MQLRSSLQRVAQVQFLNFAEHLLAGQSNVLNPFKGQVQVQKITHYVVGVRKTQLCDYSLQNQNSLRAWHYMQLFSIFLVNQAY